MKAKKASSLEREYDAGYRAGMEDAVRWLAMWGDGQQYVGSMGGPLDEVIESIRTTPLGRLKRDGW